MWNCSGMAEAQYRGQWVGKFADILEEVCERKGIPEWRLKYGAVTHGLYQDGLRRLLPDLGMGVWTEITTGYSMWEYRCLDAYVKVFSRGVPPPRYEAHFVLGMERPVLERHRTPRPEEWWQFRVWRSYGQRESITEYELNDVRANEALVRRARGMRMAMRDGGDRVRFGPY